ncbi:MAG: MBL fold metallo-hydrolase [Proteobacteria bacterium]|nr:MBL fold metallo-hydrolase [Pseudomonadota bacterium]
MIRNALIVLSFIFSIIISTVLYATRDSLVSEHIRDNLDITTITVNNAKIYLVERNGKTIMIDSGNPGDEEKIEAYMAEAGLEPSAIDYLIITHGHLDHIGTAAYFQSRYDIKVIGGQGDALMFSEGIQQPLCATSLMASAIDMSLQGKTYPLLKADILVEGPYDLGQLGIKGKITPMPGHTLGTLLVSFDDIIFVGDLIRGELVRQSTPNRHFFMCDLADNDRDIATVLGMTQFTRWYPGHFGSLLAKDVARYWP